MFQGGGSRGFVKAAWYARTVDFWDCAARGHSLKAGTAEQWIKQGKQAVRMARLSCHRFRSNEVPLRLSLIACNLRSRWRLLVLAGKIGNWSLTQPATTAGGDPRHAGQARPMLLADARREPSDVPVVWKHGAQDRGAAGDGGVKIGSEGKS